MKLIYGSVVNTVNTDFGLHKSWEIHFYQQNDYHLLSEGSGAWSWKRRCDVATWFGIDV